MLTAANWRSWCGTLPSRASLPKCCNMFRLLFLHICERRCNGGGKFGVIVILLDFTRRAIDLTGWISRRLLRKRSEATTRDRTLALLQTHCQSFLQFCVEAIVYACITRLHRALIQGPATTMVPCPVLWYGPRLTTLFCQFSVASIVNANRLQYAKMW